MNADRLDMIRWARTIHPPTRLGANEPLIRFEDLPEAERAALVEAAMGCPCCDEGDEAAG